MTMFLLFAISFRTLNSGVRFLGELSTINDNDIKVTLIESLLIERNLPALNKKQSLRNKVSS